MLASILAVFARILLGVEVFAKELMKLYGINRDVSRAHLSSRGFLVALEYKKETAGDLAWCGGSGSAENNDWWQSGTIKMIKITPGIPEETRANNHVCIREAPLKPTLLLELVF